MTHLTYSERERAAYCAGHTRASDLLGKLADNEAAQDGQESAQVYINEAMTQYPSEDSLQHIISAMHALCKSIRGDNRTALLAIVEDLTQAQSDLMHAGEYGKDELKKAINAIQLTV